MCSSSRRLTRGLAVVLVSITWTLPGNLLRGAPLEPVPVAEKRPVYDEYHGVRVEDDYQWLETADDPQVKHWVAEENARTRAYLDALPDRAKIAARLTELYDHVSPNYTSLVSRPAGLFALKFQPPKQQPMLVLLKNADDPASAKVVLDPNDLEPKGKVAIDWYAASARGKLVAVSLSKNGSEDGTLHFYRTDSGEALEDVIPRVQYPTAGGSAAWVGDEGVFYTSYPHPGERPAADANFFQQVYLHKLGTDPQQDRYALGQGFPRIAEIALEASADDTAIVATVENGDGGEYAHYLLQVPPTSRGKEPSAAPADTAAWQTTLGSWKQLTHFEDKIRVVQVTSPGSILMLSIKDAPRGKIVRRSVGSENAAESAGDTTVVPEDPEATIEGMTVAQGHLFVTDMVGGPSRVRCFDLDGKDGKVLPLPPISSVGQVVRLTGEPQGVLLRQVSYTTPFVWLHYDVTQGDALHRTKLAGTSPVDFSDIEVVRAMATSKDGTKVPLNILQRKGTKRDGTNPTLLYGYGGYSIDLTPNFVFSRRLWFDRGGVYVVANLRGGGEFGEAWHLAGNLTHKQNVFDDFAACAQYLVTAGYTNPQRLAVEGGSNGGLLMGAFLTQHPDLARAVVSHVGIYDMLRVELDPNGAFNVTEFGTVKAPDQFKALYAYSPYHHVVDGTKYPAVLFMTGDNDGRVNPANSRKMTARLQAADASDLPILLRTTASAGHGMGTALSERIAQEADADAFLFEQLDMKTPSSHGEEKEPAAQH